MVEATACGPPVVAFDHGGPVDIVDHRQNGYLAHAFEPEALADGIAWCCEDGARAVALGRQGREKAERLFDIEVVAAQYRSLYGRILGRGS